MDNYVIVQAIVALRLPLAVIFDANLAIKAAGVRESSVNLFYINVYDIYFLSFAIALRLCVQNFQN